MISGLAESACLTQPTAIGLGAGVWAWVVGRAFISTAKS